MKSTITLLLIIGTALFSVAFAVLWVLFSIGALPLRIEKFMNWLKKNKYRWAKIISISLFLVFSLAEMYWYYIYLGHPYP